MADVSGAGRLLYGTATVTGPTVRLGGPQQVLGLLSRPRIVRGHGAAPAVTPSNPPVRFAADGRAWPGRSAVGRTSRTACLREAVLTQTIQRFVTPGCHMPNAPRLHRERDGPRGLRRQVPLLLTLRYEGTGCRPRNPMIALIVPS